MVILHRPDLSKRQIADNLLAVITSDYFSKYEIPPGKGVIKTDSVIINALGWRAEGAAYKLGDLSDLLTSTFHFIKEKGDLLEVRLYLRLPEASYTGLGLDPRLFKDDRRRLQVNFAILPDEVPPEKLYTFVVTATETEESYSKGMGMTMTSFRRRLKGWYAHIEDALQALPYQLRKR